MEGTTNDAAQAGTDLPYYHPLRMLVYKAFEALRLLYAVALPLALAAALARQLYLGWGMLRSRSADGLLLWLALAALGLLPSPLPQPTRRAAPTPSCPAAGQQRYACAPIRSAWNSGSPTAPRLS